MNFYKYSKHIAFQKEPSTNVIYILDKKHDEMILLEETSAEIWELLEQYENINLIIEILCKRYNMSPFFL